MIFLKMSDNCHDSFRDVRGTVMIILRDVRETVMIFLKISHNCHDSFRDVRGTVMIVLKMSEKLS